ncbi:N-acetylglucosaminyltransferase, partial [Gardnerella vaginalis]
FIRESRFTNNSRMLFGSSCHAGGTGFMFSREIMHRNRGWKFHLLTEDLEFTMDSILHGDKVGYCGSAVLYDEQPVSFRQSWRQRLRWSKGFLQVFRYYGAALIRHGIRERDFSSVDFTLMLCPFMVLAIVRLILGFIFAAFGFVTWTSQIDSTLNFITTTVTSVLGMMVFVSLTILVEHDKLGATNKELFAYALSFPIFMLSYVPIAFQAVFSKSEWKPIHHTGR